MKILFEHSGILPVKRYGGTERILYWHMKELVRQGHEVFLIGHPQSEVTSIGVKLIHRAEGVDWRHQVPAGIDIIHVFYDPGEAVVKEFPVLVTIQGNGQQGEFFPKNTTFVSRKHAEIHGAKQFVHNCLDFSEYPKHLRKNPKRFDHFLFLAKASWKVKNLDHCIKAARRNHKHLHIAGGKHYLSYFSTLVHSYGMVDQAGKNNLFDKTDALLWPVRWHEPFGIAIIEAFAGGLPVIASPYGSMPELITEKVGKICSSLTELTEFLSARENPFDSEQIRHYVETQFDVSIMTGHYLNYYKLVVAGNLLNETNPTWALPHHAEDLLSF